MKRLLPMLLLVFAVGVEAETINYSGGGIYVGQVSNGTPNGQGSMTWTDGAKYVGDWKDGETHGQGTFTDGGGGKYVGGWKDGKMHGEGASAYPDGRNGLFTDLWYGITSSISIPWCQMYIERRGLT